MALVVFMRAVNVGGHQTFQPSKLARDLSALDIVSIGAAGTFVVRGKVTEAKLRKALNASLTFEPEMVICPAGELSALTAEKSLKAAGAGINRYITVMAKLPVSLPKMPIVAPEAGEWQTRIVAIKGRFAISERRVSGKVQIYPNELIEKRLKVSATTRNWTTLVKICDILDK